MKWLIKRVNLKNQKGFTLMEVVVACALIAILSSIAIPKFFTSVVTANTVKVKSDLQTIDTAIVLYMTDNGSTPANVSELKDYIIDAQNLKPPTGKECYLKGQDTPVKIADSDYKIQSIDNDYRATCDGKTANEYGK
ncbi:MAG: prepilin-type N-terminal cleavage/methylation domain-containing protein [Selenomonadaceae bacterium]|nr:prepilin-type N-terminal cleavage/methylation domain-containing protein [Selenomonadaceae bacterium]